MLNGIILGKKMWDVDVKYSKYWTPKKYGIDFPLSIDRPDVLNKLKIDTRKYKFLIVSDVWSIKTRIAIENARKKGLKIFLLPRETFIFCDEFMFNDTRFLHNNEHYLTPDVVFASGKLYENKWKDKTKVYLTGHPRFDYCLYENWQNRENVIERYGLEKDRKILFFPSYTIFNSKGYKHSQAFKKWGEVFGDVFDEREGMMEALLEFSKSRDDIQVVTKLHPMSSAALRKKGITKDIEGITLKYLKNPTKNFKVIDGLKDTRRAARDILTAADFIVGYNSTMMFEAAVLGKPVLRSVFNKTNNVHLLPEYEKIFTTSSGKDDTINKLNEMIEDGVKNFTIPDIEKYIRLDKNVCERICNAIKSELG